MDSLDSSIGGDRPLGRTGVRYPVRDHYLSDFFYLKRPLSPSQLSKLRSKEVERLRGFIAVILIGRYCP